MPAETFGSRSLISTGHDFVNEKFAVVGRWLTMNFDRILILISASSLLYVVGYAILSQSSKPSSATWSPPVASPAIVCESDHFDFGRQQEQEVATHAFVVSNQTDKAYKVADVRATCGCLITRTELTGSQLDPGRFIHVPVAVDLQGKAGRFQGFVWVHFVPTESSDAQYGEQVIKLSVSGDVDALLVADPSTVDFGRLIPGAAREVTIRRTDGKSLSMPTFHSTSSLISVADTELQENHCTIQLVVLDFEDVGNDPKLESALNVTVPGVSAVAGNLSIPVTGSFFDQNFQVTPSRFVFNSRRLKQRLIVDGEEETLRSMELTTNFEAEVELHVEPIEANQAGRREFWLEWKLAHKLKQEGGHYVKGEVVLSSQAGSLKLPVMVGP